MAKNNKSAAVSKSDQILSEQLSDMGVTDHKVQKSVVTSPKPRGIRPDDQRHQARRQAQAHSRRRGSERRADVEDPAHPHPAGAGPTDVLRAYIPNDNERHEAVRLLKSDEQPRRTTTM
ncbi:hypothetical protein [Xanthomonas phage JGB6]|nr:hypothetical protein [Xanthomonas phage JGB6]